MQCLRPLSQDERGQPTASEAPEASGECDRERARAIRGIKELLAPTNSVVSGFLKDGLRIEAQAL